MDLTGKDLTDLMIHATNLTNGILQVSKSVHVVYDSTKPLGKRLIKFTVNNQPIDPTRYIGLLHTHFVRQVAMDLKHF